MRSFGRHARGWRDRVLGRLAGAHDGRHVVSYLKDHDALIARRIDGIALLCHPDKIGRLLLTRGLWQKREFDAAVDVLRRMGKLDARGAFVDVGANIGMHSVYAAKAGCFSRIVAIEPQADNHALLLNNLALNEVTGFAALNVAVGADDGEITLYRNAGNSGKSNLRVDMGGGAEVVAMRTLDGLLQEQGIKPGAVGLVWMDVEGYEHEAIAGMEQVLEAAPPMVVEITPDYLGSRLADLVARLAAHYDGYRLLSDPSAGRFPVAGLASTREQIDILLV